MPLPRLWAKRGGVERTCRGQIASGEVAHIPLFGGDPLYGWTVLEFEITSGNAAAAAFDASMGVLTTEEPGLSTWSPPGAFNLSDNRQIAWAKDFNLNAAASSGNWSLVDADNIITQDLYAVLWNRTADPGAINYYIRMKRVKISAFERLFATIRGFSQDV